MKRNCCCCCCCCKYFGQQLAENRTVRLLQEPRQGEAQEPAALHSQHGRSRQVGLHDQAPLIQGEIAHRCEVIEVGVFVPGFGQLGLGLAEFLILHLQLDLLHPQLVDQPGALFL